MKRLIAASLLTLACMGAFAFENSDDVKVMPLLRTQTSWDGKLIVYPKGPAQVSAMTIEIAPGKETGWHSHPVPSFGFVLEGTLEVTLRDGSKKKFETGQAVPEVVDVPHNGRNVGTTPLKLLVVYAGTIEKPITNPENPPGKDEKTGKDEKKAAPVKPEKKTP